MYITTLIINILKIIIQFPVFFDLLELQKNKR